MQLRVYDSVTSTNTVCAEHAAQPDFVSPFICVADQQTAGRGRRGRVWDSPPGAGVCVSVAWRIAQVDHWQGLSLAVGLQVVQTLETVFSIGGLQLKWPNDILWNGRKLGGVLIDIVRDAQQSPVLIVGVGVNCQRPMTAQSVPDTVRAYVSDTTPQEVARSQLTAELLLALMQLLSVFDARGFAAYRVDWERYDAYRDKEVMLLADGQAALLGVEQGVTEQGELCVQVDGVTQCVSVGEVSLRLPS